MVASNVGSFGSPASDPSPPAPIPVVRLRSETVLVTGGDGLGGDFEELELPVIELAFRYGSETIHPRPEGLLGPSSGLRDVAEAMTPATGRPLLRNLAAEEGARRLLESFGAVEFDCLEGIEPSFDSTADYVVRVDGDVHAYCHFGAYVLPQLEAMGWTVHVDDAYPYRTIRSSAPWYVELDPSEKSDWFALELGVVIDGQRVDLVAAMVELLDRGADSGQSLESIGALTGRSVALPVGDRLYLPVAYERLHRILAILRELYDRAAGNASRDGEIPLYRLEVGALGALHEAIVDATGNEPEFFGSEEIRELALGVRQTKSEIDKRPPGLRAELRPYQVEGVAFLQNLRRFGVGGILADDMGLGKTLQTIAHLQLEKVRGRLSDPAIVVAPTSLIGNWEREMRKFAPGLKVLVLHGARRRNRAHGIDRHDVVVTTYGVVVRDEELRQRGFSTMVLDEAQTIKNTTSQVHGAVRELKAEHRICLTGTPMENHLGELWALFDFLAPGLLGAREEFRARYRTPIEMGDEERAAMLKARVAPFILRRVKSEVAKELPPKTEIVRPVTFSEPQRELYESIRVSAHAEVRKLIRKRGLAASTVQVLDALMKLRQACCDPRLVTMDSAREVKGSAKYEALFELLATLLSDGRKVLIFSQFTRMLALVGDGLANRGIRYACLTGATSNRQAQVDRFQGGDVDVFLISLKAGGTGLNLTRADTVIHYDPWWNPAVQAQATDRAYRIGQDQPVFVYNLIVAGSVEERMLQLQEHKRALSRAVLDGAGLSAGGFNAEDVEELFAPMSGQQGPASVPPSRPSAPGSERPRRSPEGPVAANDT